MVVVTGGLGPTDDDLTKETLASFLGQSLVLNQDALAALTAFFSERNRPMPEANIKQAYCIEGGELLPNPNGTAPGQYVYDEVQGVHYFLLPGPPLEMNPMLTREVLPRLSKAFSGHGVVQSRVLHLCGIGESDVDAQIGDVTRLDNPTVAPLAGEGEMLLRITASADDEAAATQLIHPIEMRLRESFREFIYGEDEDTLPSVVGRLLSQQNQTLSTAESCTGGLLASMLTSIPGASSYFLGSIVSYHNDVKENLLGVLSETLEQVGAVSETVAVQMAEGARRACSSTYAISLTGVAGPDGGTALKPVGLVYGAISGPNGTTCYRMQHRGSREQIRLRASKHMLWRLWSLLQLQLSNLER